MSSEPGDEPSSPGPERGFRGLSQAELAAVLRRATELDARGDLELPEARLDPALVEAAAVEAGLSRAAVRQAMGEVLQGADTPQVYADKGLLPVSQLAVVREVPGASDELDARIGHFLRRQLFTQQRIFANGSRWAPRKGWTANIRRGTDPGGRFVLKSVRSVEVTLTPTAEDRVVVRVVLDLSQLRTTHRSYLAGGAAGGVLVGGGAVAAFGVDPITLAAVPVAGGVVVGGHFLGRATARNEAEGIHTAVAGLLDRLEHPDRDQSGRRRKPR